MLSCWRDFAIFPCWSLRSLSRRAAQSLFLALALFEIGDAFRVGGQLALDGADAARRGFKRGAELADFPVELLQANQVLEGLVHRWQESKPF